MDEDNIVFNDFMFEAFDHAVSNIEETTDSLIPFTMVELNDGKKNLNRFFCECIEEGLEQAKQSIEDNKFNLKMYAIAYDGYLTIENKKWEAVFVEAGSKDKDTAMILAQRYEKKGIFRKKNITIGNPALVQEIPSKLLE